MNYAGRCGWLFVGTLLISACANTPPVTLSTPTAAPAQQAAAPTAAPAPPTATAEPTVAPRASAIASVTPIPTSTAAPTATPAPATAEPTLVPPTRSAVPHSPTPVPAATAPPAQAAPAAPTLAGAHQHLFPVQSQGKVSYGKFHHDYPAADMFCPIGSTFVAVTDGVVDFVSREDLWDAKLNDGATRGGLSVAIIGDDGVRYYGSHLSEVTAGIEPGVRVTAGQQLGLTGKSGDARFTDAHLHFGISQPTTAEDWAVRRGQLAPYPYLKAWQRGENLTPELPSGE